MMRSSKMENRRFHFVSFAMLLAFSFWAFTILSVNRCVISNVSATGRVGLQQDISQPKEQAFQKSGPFPKIVHQTWITKDDSKFHHQKKMIKANPSWNFVLHDDNDVNEFFLKYSKDDAVIAKAKKAYDLIHPNLGAAKADVFRYAVMYKIGGMYLDMDANCNDFDSLLKDMEDSEGVEFLGTHSGNKELWYLMQLPRSNVVQWVFLAYPYNPIFKNTISVVLDNLLHGLEDKEICVKNMTKAVKEVTGPFAFNRGFDMTRVEGYNKFKIQGFDFDKRCACKVVSGYYPPGESYDEQKENMPL